MTDRIDTRDAYGDEFALVKGAALLAIEPAAEKRGGVAGARAWDTRIVVLTEDGAVQVASFLGNAVSPAAARDLLTELAPRVCADDMHESIKAFLLGASPEWMQRTVAQGLERGALVRQLVELGRALGRAESVGVDLVGAARKVTKFAGRGSFAGMTPLDLFECRKAIDTLASELAKLDGGT